MPRMPECSKECRVSFMHAHPHLALGCMEPISWPGTPSVTTETYGVPNSPRCTRLHSLPNYSLHQVPLLSYPRRLLRVYTWGAGCFYSEPLGCKTFLFQKMLPGSWEKRKSECKGPLGLCFSLKNAHRPEGKRAGLSSGGVARLGPAMPQGQVSLIMDKLSRAWQSFTSARREQPQNWEQDSLAPCC